MSTDSVFRPNNDQGQNFTMAFMKSQTPSGIPPHRLYVKIDAILMFLCKPSHFKALQYHKNSIEMYFVGGRHRSSIVLIPRIKLNLSNANVPLTLNRIQFPVGLSYVTRINKT